MKSGKYIRVIYSGIAVILLLAGFACQRSPLAPDDDLVSHLQALSDSSSLKKQDVETNDPITTEELDELRGYPLEESHSNKSVNIPPILGYVLVAIIIIGFGAIFYFVVIKRIKDGIGDMGYQIKHAKDKIEETISQKTPKDLKAEDKEQINKLLEQLKKFDKK